jgi:acyl-CoA dehydrogenase
VLEPSDVRDRLTRYMYVSTDPDDPTGLLEHALPRVIAAEAIERKIERGIREGHVRRYHGRDWVREAEDKGVITASEAALVREAEALMQRVIAVDHFDPQEVKPHYRHLSNTTVHTPSMAAALPSRAAE